jgi:hypothetical protein
MHDAGGSRGLRSQRDCAREIINVNHLDRPWRARGYGQNAARGQPEEPQQFAVTRAVHGRRAQDHYLDPLVSFEACALAAEFAPPVSR